MNSNVRHGLRPLSDVMLDWMDSIDEHWKTEEKEQPPAMKKCFKKMREKIKTPRAA